jgi:hypothetical protein
MKLVAKALLISGFHKSRAKVTMNFKCGAENRTCSRVSSILFVFARLDVNRLNSTAHLTISTQNF